MKRRRAFLGLIAATALAGCSGNDGSTEDTPVDTPTPADTPEPTPTEKTPKETPTDTPTPEPTIYVRHVRDEVDIKELTVTGQLENTDSPVTVALEVAGQVVETQATTEFEITATDVPPGQQEYTVATRDHSQSATTEIPEPLQLVDMFHVVSTTENGDGDGNEAEIDPVRLRNPNDVPYEDLTQDFEVYVEGELIKEGTFSRRNYAAGEDHYELHTLEEGAYRVRFDLPWEYMGGLDDAPSAVIRTHGSELSFDVDQNMPPDLTTEDVDAREEYGHLLDGAEGTGALYDGTTPAIQNDNIDEVELVLGFGDPNNEIGEGLFVERYRIPDMTVEHDVKLKMEVVPTTPGTTSPWGTIHPEPDELPDRSITDVPENHFRRLFIAETKDIHRDRNNGYISYTMEVMNLYDEPASVEVITSPHLWFHEDWPRKEITIEMSGDEDLKEVEFEHDFEPTDGYGTNNPGIVMKQD